MGSCRDVLGEGPEFQLDCCMSDGGSEPGDIENQRREFYEEQRGNACWGSGVKQRNKWTLQRCSEHLDTSYELYMRPGQLQFQSNYGTGM